MFLVALVYMSISNIAHEQIDIYGGPWQYKEEVIKLW